MSRALEVIVWAIAWVGGILVIGVGASYLPEPARTHIAFGGGLAWGFYMGGVLFNKILDY